MIVSSPRLCWTLPTCSLNVLSTNLLFTNLNTPSPKPDQKIKSDLHVEFYESVSKTGFIRTMSKVNKIVSLCAVVWTGYITGKLFTQRKLIQTHERPFIEERRLIHLDPKIIIYNRVQKCGSRSVLQSVRPVLEFNPGFNLC